MARFQKIALNLSADDVWASACAAQRINGTYVKAVTSYAQAEDILPNSFEPSKETNRQIIDRFLADTSQITDSDREQGVEVRKYYQALTFKVLKGIKLSDFDNTAMLISNRDIINDNYDVAVIASLPASFERAKVRMDADSKINFAKGGYIGSINDKVTVNVNIVKNVFSKNWNTYYATGITADDNVVFFAIRDGVTVGKDYVIQGNVKAHRDGSTTQLNRVKVVK